MTAKTHFAFSFLLVSAVGLPRDLALITSIASLLPDIDHTSSLLGRLMPGISKAIMSRHGHRTVTHSLFTVVALAIITLPLAFFYPVIYKGILLAYFSHIFIDCFNLTGIRLFYPFSQKEYISFKTESLRIKVSSWKEFTVFLSIIFLVVLLSGRSVSLTGAAFSISRMFFKSYSIAYKTYREQAGYSCTGEISYFNNLKRTKESLSAPVLAMDSGKVIVKKGSERLVINTADVVQIKIKSEKKPLNLQSFKSLKDVPSGNNFYISGIITYHNYIPKIKDSDFITTSLMPTSMKITVNAINRAELRDLLNISLEVEKEKESLKKKLPAYRLKLLQVEEVKLQRRIEALSKQGLYANYKKIEALSSKLKNNQNKQESLLLLAGESSSSADSARLNQLMNFKIESDLMWWRVE
jgi:membrane-bound metal-dependent hydrolase YbcI (DUF457 family)